MDTTSLGYYSRLFLVTKPDGSFHPIIDLKKLNQFIVVPSFKMETLFSIIAALQPQEWITKIDLKDAYHHILVHVNIRKYFRFVVAGTVYQFRDLPFGLSTASREFTKTLAPVIQLLRSQGIQVHAYLDDWIIRTTSQEQSLEHTQHIIQLLQSLGWTINWNKSMLQPSRILDFLGLHFNLEQALISPDLSPRSYPVYLHRRSCLLGKFHPSSAGCHTLPHLYQAAVFIYVFSSSGSNNSGLNISSRGILQSSCMRTSSLTCVGFYIQQWWQGFRYIFRTPVCSSSRMHLSKAGEPVGKTIRFPDYGQLQTPNVISTGLN